MVRAESGSSVLASHGGPWTKKGWDVKQQTLLAATERLLRSELNLWKGDGQQSPWNRLRFVLTADEEANGFAHYGFGWHMIAVTAGLALQIWDAIERLTLSKTWLASVLAFDPPLLSEDSENNLMIEVGEAALRWTFNHELAHCFRGHCLFVPDGFERTLYEAGTFQPGFDKELARFFELDADAVATNVLLSVFSESMLDTLEKREMWFTQTLFGIGLVTLLLDRNQANLETYTTSSHPHPFIRLQLAIDFAGGAATQELKLPLVRAQKCAESAVRSLATAAATLGYKASTWILSPPDYRRALEYQIADKSLFERLASQLLRNTSSFGHARWFGRS